MSTLFAPTWRASRRQSPNSGDSGDSPVGNPENPKRGPSNPYSGSSGSSREVIANLPPAVSGSCCRCGGTLEAPGDVVCAPCFAALRPGSQERGPVVRMDEARRRRLEAHLRNRFCADCGGSWWRVQPNGDAACWPCTLTRRRRMSTVIPAKGDSP